MNPGLNALPMTTAVWIALSLAPAFAHPTFVRSEPVAGGTASAPGSVSLWLSEKIEPVFHKIEVVDASGSHFEDGKSVVDAADGMRLHVRLKPLVAGQYKVRWRASAADTHKVEGSFTFMVAP